MNLLKTIGAGMVRQCTWNIPNWENKETNCPKNVQYCAIDNQGESENNRQEDPYRCDTWKHICFCKDSLCNHGSKMHLHFCIVLISITALII